MKQQSLLTSTYEVHAHWDRFAAAYRDLKIKMHGEIRRSFSDCFTGYAIFTHVELTKEQIAKLREIFRWDIRITEERYEPSAEEQHAS